MSLVQTLRNYLNNEVNQQFKVDFHQAFRFALTYNIKQFEDFGIKTFDNYLDYYEEFLHWVPTETSDGKNIYYHICIFYFVLDLPPMKHYQSCIHHRSHWTWLSQWIIEFSKEVGKFHNTEASLTETSLDSFKRSPLYRVDDYDNDGWKTFNQFFARKFKPNMREWEPDTCGEVVITHPADSVFNGPWPVDETNHVEFIKHVPWNISQLLDGTLYGDQFAGGQFIHSFLNTYDYHRQHAPVSGKIVDARVIPGLCYLEVIPVEHKSGGTNNKTQTKLLMKRKLAHHHKHQASLAEHGPQDMDAPDTPGYQFIQARGLIVIDNPDIGLVAVLPIGMAQVSSVVLSVKVGQEVEKGAEIAYFQMGGSDCIMIFQGGVKVDFTAKPGKKYHVGKTIATAKKGQRQAGVGQRSVEVTTPPVSA